jgi:hypothetical protein
MIAFDHIAALFDQAFRQKTHVALFGWSGATAVVIRWSLEISDHAETSDCQDT